MDLNTFMLDQSAIGNFLTGSALGALFGVAIILGILISIAFYIYFALAWQTIAKKLKYDKPWLAWIPIANIAMILQLGNFHWAWIFLILVPILGWIALVVLIVVANWRTFEKREYPGWFSLSQIIPKIGGILYLIAIGFVAWQDKPKAKKTEKKPAKKKAKSKK
jgi:uncharacterized membrane protein YciS (DUF1049 family)